jgi:HAD superfamily hydrolase (TIGR01490 family)
VKEKKRIAFFDFDGTVTRRDTLAAVIRFQKGSLAFYAGMLLQAPRLLAWKLGLVSRDEAKQRILTYFFGGMREAVFRQHCDAFVEKKLLGLIRPAALAEISKLKAEKTEIVIASASAENWIRPWSDSLQLELVATRLEVKEGRITGRIAGKNCYGEEKARRILERWNLEEYAEVYAYGDSKGDKPMLALAGRSFFKPFRPE